MYNDWSSSGNDFVIDLMNYCGNLYAYEKLSEVKGTTINKKRIWRGVKMYYSDTIM